MTLKHVRAGDQYEPSAMAHNAFVDAALHHRRSRLTIGPAAPEGFDEHTIWIKNTTEEDQQFFRVLAIDEEVIQTTLDDSQTRISATGIAPDPETTPSHRYRIAICAETIAAGDIGRGWIGGNRVLPVHVLDLSHTRARVLDDGTLQSGFFGPVRIVAAAEEGEAKPCRVVIDGYDGGHCIVKVPSGGIGSGSWGTPSETTCVLAWPDPDDHSPVEVEDSEVTVVHYGPEISSDREYVHCRVEAGRIIPDVAYCDSE